jgi:hypothetical protein
MRTLGIMLIPIILSSACGVLVRDQVKRYTQISDDTEANTEESNLERTDDGIVPINCAQEKSDLEFANAVYQNLFVRSLTNAESSEVLSGISRTEFVEEALTKSEAGNGISRFLTNLFRLNNIVANPAAMDLIAEASLVSDLRKEPIELVLRNLDKPWSYFFSSRDIFCTKYTAKIYGVPEFEASAFMSCQLPDDRAGFLGLASVLRANPSSIASTNNNYHRVALAVYLSTGVKLLAATNGPTGEGLGIPLPACVPSTDTRVTTEGLIYGTASVPAAGAVCASCHSRFNGPLSVAFRRFQADGSTYTFEAIDQLNDGTVVTPLGTTKDELKFLLNETDSCWSFDGGITPPRNFAGVPGLGRLIAESGELGQALGIQIPQMMGNIEGDPNMSSTINKFYQDEGETLRSAIKGYLLSDSFQCAIKEE